MIQQGHGCDWFAPQKFGAASGADSASQEVRVALGSWLRSLAKPCALLAFHCVLGRRIIEVRNEASIDVPNDIAVLGGEHDGIRVKLSSPPLGSLDLSTRTIGREAARLLDGMMGGDSPGPLTKLIPPGGVYERQSTNAVAIDNPDVSAAASFILQKAKSGIKTFDVLKAVPVSRRTLEKGFKKHFNRTPAEEIRRVRVDAAAEALRSTDMQVAHVAQDSGFESSEVFIRAFGRQFGLTPTEYRKSFRS